jgi:hypothetical protein
VAGQYIAEHPRIAKVAFTGSTATGRRIVQASAGNLKKVQLELGGKGANIVFDDANLTAAVNGSAWAIFHNQGQACIAGSRLMLQESIADEFLERFATLARSIRLGHPMDPATEMGTVIDETAARGISVRQLLVMYERVKRRCVAEGWTNWAGELLTPETVTLYDLNKYVIMPATKAHQCSYVELVTGPGEDSARRCPDGHVPMARTIVYEDSENRKAEEVSCTQCAKKLEADATYWVCHRCGDRHKLCGECAPAPAPVKCAKFQEPLWFVSHWYGRRRCVPQRRRNERMCRV